MKTFFDVAKKYSPLVLFLAALVLFTTSLLVEPFRLVDGKDFLESVPHGDDAAYSKFRREALTQKFTLQDFAFFFALLFVVFGWSKWFNGIRVPRSRLTFFLIAILAPVMTIISLGMQLELARHRRVYPPWPQDFDTWGILLVFVILCFWSMLVFVVPLVKAGSLRKGTRLSLAMIRSGNRIFVVLAALNFVSSCAFVYLGAPALLLCCALWIYYYLSVAVQGSPNIVPA